MLSINEILILNSLPFVMTAIFNFRIFFRRNSASHYEKRRLRPDKPLVSAHPFIATSEFPGRRLFEFSENARRPAVDSNLANFCGLRISSSAFQSSHSPRGLTVPFHRDDFEKMAVGAFYGRRRSAKSFLCPSRLDLAKHFVVSSSEKEKT